MKLVLWFGFDDFHQELRVIGGSSQKTAGGPIPGEVDRARRSKRKWIAVHIVRTRTVLRKLVTPYVSARSHPKWDDESGFHEFAEVGSTDPQASFKRIAMIRVSVSRKISHNGLKVVISLTRVGPFRPGSRYNSQRFACRSPVGNETARMREDVARGDQVEPGITVEQTAPRIPGQRSIQIEDTFLTQLEDHVRE